MFVDFATRGSISVCYFRSGRSVIGGLLPISSVGSFYLPDRRDEFIRDRRSGHGIGRIEKVQSCAVGQFRFLVAVKVDREM
jgi:hypothetical protein